MLSARGNNYISLLEFLQNYPLPEVFLDGKRLAEIGQRVGNTRERVERYLETMAAVVQQILSEPLCACEADVRALDDPGSPGQ